jgi:hypothetical protein
MGAIVGVLVGYAIGTRAGPEGWEESVEALKVIINSQEVQDLVSGGLAIARELMGRGGGRLAELLGATPGEPRLEAIA